MELEEIKILSLVITSIIGIFLLVKGLAEYTKKNTLDRAIVYLELRKRFKETENFSKIISYLDTDEERISEICIKDRLKFLGFFDDIAIMVNSGLLNEYIVHQSFGFYIIKVWDNKHMWWEENKRDSDYRLLLKSLKDRCIKLRNNNSKIITTKYKF